MIVVNAIIGLCLLWGGARHHEQGFQIHGASAKLLPVVLVGVVALAKSPTPTKPLRDGRRGEPPLRRGLP